jgi:hypothetical protein
MIFNRVLPFNANSLLERKGDLRSRKIARFGLVITLFIVINTAFQEISSATSNYKPTHYKQYILMTLNDIDQTHCLIDLYSRENSQWNPKARNGSHWGIPQGRSTYLSKVDGIKQITWGVRYIGNRYGWIDEVNQVPNACAAWNHFLKKGWH